MRLVIQLPLLLSIALASFNPAAAQLIDTQASNDELPAMVAISPGRLELELEGNRVDSAFKLFNLSDEPIRIQTEVHHWDLDEANAVRVIAPSETSLDQWLVVSPLAFTIAPRSSQVVRVSARPPFKLENKEYRAMLSFIQQQDAVNESIGIRVSFRLNAVIYVTGGKVLRVGELKSIRVNQSQTPRQLEIIVESQGDGGIRLNGQVSVWSEQAYPGQGNVPEYLLTGKLRNVPDEVVFVSALSNLPIFPDTTRTLILPLKLPIDAQSAMMVHVQGQLGEDGERFEHTFKLD